MNEHCTIKNTFYETSYTAKSYNRDALEAYRRHHNEMVKPSSEQLSHRIGKGVMMAALYAGSMFVSEVSEGVTQGKEHVHNDHAQIHSIYQSSELPPELQNHATFVLTGLGTKDPSETAKSLESHQKVGHVYAVEYSNDSLDTQDIAKRVIETALEDDLESISFDGYSAGGPIALAIAAHIHENEPALRILSVTLNSSPIGHDGLSERSEKSLAIMNRLLSINDDLVYYEKGRAAIEVLARSDRYIVQPETSSIKGFWPTGINSFTVANKRYEIDYRSLREEVRSVNEKMNDPKAAPANLIKHQADFITTTDYNNNLRRLAPSAKNEFKSPLIIYTRSHLPQDDSVVNVVASEDNLIRSLEQHENRYVTFSADIGHANPTERPDEYASIIQQKIQPKLLRSLEFLATQEAIKQSLFFGIGQGSEIEQGDTTNRSPYR